MVNSNDFCRVLSSNTFPNMWVEELDGKKITEVEFVAADLWIRIINAKADRFRSFPCCFLASRLFFLECRSCSCFAHFCVNYAVSSQKHATITLENYDPCNFRVCNHILPGQKMSEGSRIDTEPWLLTEGGKNNQYHTDRKTSWN